MLASGFVATVGLLALAAACADSRLRTYNTWFIILGVGAVLFGLPAYFAARLRGAVAPRNAALAGAGAGAVAWLISTLGKFGSYSASIGGAETWRDGVPTGYGMVQEFMFLAGLSGIGVAAGLTLCAMLPREVLAGEYDERNPRWRDALPLMLGAIAIAANPVIERQTRDRSCHNLFRADDAPSSVAPVVTLHLAVPRTAWPDVERELASFAAVAKLSLRSDVRPDPDYPWFQASLCRDPDVLLKVDRGFSVELQGQLMVSAYSLDRSSTWQLPMRQLVQRLSAFGTVYREPDVPQSETPDWIRELPALPDIAPPQATRP